MKLIPLTFALLIAATAQAQDYLKAERQKCIDIATATNNPFTGKSEVNEALQLRAECLKNLRAIAQEETALAKEENEQRAIRQSSRQASIQASAPTFPANAIMGAAGQAGSPQAPSGQVGQRSGRLAAPTPAKRAAVAAPAPQVASPPAAVPVAVPPPVRVDPVTSATLVGTVNQTGEKAALLSMMGKVMSIKLGETVNGIQVTRIDANEVVANGRTMRLGEASNRLRPSAVSAPPTPYPVQTQPLPQPVQVQPQPTPASPGNPFLDLPPVNN